MTFKTNDKINQLMVAFNSGWANEIPTQKKPPKKTQKKPKKKHLKKPTKIGFFWVFWVF